MKSTELKTELLKLKQEADAGLIFESEHAVEILLQAEMKLEEKDLEIKGQLQIIVHAMSSEFAINKSIEKSIHQTIDKTISLL